MKRYQLQLKNFFLFLLLGITSFSWGQEIPKITHFTKDIYQAQNQNWGISQADDCRMFFANSKGLLEFDGQHWSNYPLPNRQIVRAIAYGKDGYIYTGGYASFGYWKPNNLGQLQYFNLTQLLNAEATEGEEIWNIITLKDRVIFQSFTKLFIYQDGKLQSLLPPSNIMFLQEVNQQVLIPTVEKGIFILQPDHTFERIAGSKIFHNKRIATILPFGNDRWLIGNQTGELYTYDSNKFELIENELSIFLKNYQLNNGILLKNGNYVFGTILQGIIEVNSNLEIIRNINQENGLQNNTVLSLHENQDGNLWVGMDKGIDWIELNGNLTFFNDINGQLGTVYSAVKTDKYFYVGTNQGVFFKKRNNALNFSSNQSFQLLEGSQGQVWQLKIIDGQIFCGHNSGTFLIKETQIKKISTHAGGWWITPFPAKDEILLQGTYTGLVSYTKSKKGWEYAHKVEGINFPLKKILIDSTGTIWGISPHKSIYSFQISKDLKKITSIKEWTENDGLATEFTLDISLVQNRILVKSGNQFLEFSISSQSFVPIQKVDYISLEGENYKILDFGGAGYFKIYPNQVIWHHNQDARKFDLSLVPRYENIIQLDSLDFLFCLDDGYALLEKNKPLNKAEQDFIQPMISRISIGDEYSIFPSNLSSFPPLELKPNQNQITFFGSVPCTFGNTELEYLLEGTNENETWMNFSTPYSKEFFFLQYGDYNFKLRDKKSLATTSFSFTILPKWYQTNFAKTLYFLATVGLLYLFYKMHHRRLERQRLKMEEEKERQLKEQHIAMKNKQLQNEVILKSKELANSTMNLIKKNELLLTIKEDIKVVKKSSDKEFWRKGFHKLQSTIDKYLVNEEDWKVFESNFNQVHETFLRKLKTDYPNLTPGDLRLAAYLKMNLTSKEIAPLINISVRSVENKRHRLRQKLQLPSSTNLTGFLMRY